MPVQETSSLANYSPLEARHFRRTFVRTEWQPSCSKPPSVADDMVLLSESESQTPIGQYVISSDWIDGRIGPKPTGNWPMNACSHVSSRVSIPASTVVTLSRREESDVAYQRNPGECGPFQFTRLWTITDELYQISMGEDFWLGQIGAGGVLSTHPALPIGTSGFASKIAQLDREALDTMIPQLEGKFSLPVFVGELMELKALFKSVAKLVKGFPEFVKSLWDKPLREISDRWLEAVFGWLPLVSDVETIIQRLFGMRDAIASYLRNANKRQTLHFKKGLSPLTFQTESWFSQEFSTVIDTVGNGLYSHMSNVFREVSLDGRLVRTVDQDFFATLEFEYRIPEAESLLTSIWAKLDYWGVNYSPSDIWELVPFSFVIDWFVNLGSWFEKYDTSNLNVLVIIYDYCRTVKYSYTCVGQVVGVDNIVDPNGQTEPGVWTFPALAVASHEVNGYYRVPGVPVLTDPDLLIKLPKGMKLVTGGALSVSLWAEKLLKLLGKT